MWDFKIKFENLNVRNSERSEERTMTLGKRSQTEPREESEDSSLAASSIFIPSQAFEITIRQCFI